MTTATKLAALWLGRDRRYAVRTVYGMKMALTAEEQDSVRAWRRQEVEDLPEDERSVAFGTLSRWTAPEVERR